jgi:hypothetical protein
MAGLVFPARSQIPTPISPAFPTQMHAVHDAVPPLPITPPDSVQSTPNLEKPANSAIRLALHVLSTERAGLAHLESVYRTERFAQEAFSQAVNQIASTSRNGGKVVISGVGKSGKIGQKTEATFKSLGVDSTFLYPTDALHGDLGTINTVRLTRHRLTDMHVLTVPLEGYYTHDIILRLYQ